MKAVSRDTSQPPMIATAEDEALKRNTDCVYFLASPLTCKKGTECEYRHSEDARINPRDCWFWLNGNCLNPKCSFRHPPLDGLVATTPTSSARSSMPPSLTAGSTQLSAVNTSAHNSVKQGTPCFYFQKGLCLKGDRCLFMHGSQPIDHVAPPALVPKVATSVTEPQTLKNSLWGLEKCTQQKKTPQENVIKTVDIPPRPKPPIKVLTVPSENGIAVERTVPPVLLNNELPRHKPVNILSISGGNSVSRTHRVRQVQPLDDRNFRSGKEPDDFLGESSPGFDVLVDDELRDSDYFQKEEDFGRTTDHGRRHLNAVNEFDYGRSADYNSLEKFDRENYSDSRGYDPYGRVQDMCGWEKSGASSERISDRPSVPERRGLPRAESPDRLDGLDLRHRLSKQRRVNGSRSAVSPDYRGDSYRRDDRGHRVEDQRHRSQSRRDPRHLISNEIPISNRLKGRISLPGRSSPDSDQNDSHQEKEIHRGRKLPRLSPGRPPIVSSYLGRPQDRIKWRLQDEVNTEGRNFRGARDESDNNTLDFAGPKRLVELKKGVKVSDGDEEQPTKGKKSSFGESKNLKIRNLEGHQEMIGSSSFEGPKPLREILKRKRQEKPADSGDGMDSGNGEQNNQNEGETSVIAVTEKQSVVPSNSKEEADNQTLSSNEEYRFTGVNSLRTVDDDDEEGLIPEGVEGQASTPKGSELKTHDLMMTDKIEDQELETSDQRDVESDYEEGYGGDFKTELESNPDAEDEYFDDEDGDDFAKRIGVMFS